MEWKEGKKIQGRNCNFMQLPLITVFIQNTIWMLPFQTTCIYTLKYTLWKKLKHIWNSMFHSESPWLVTMNSKKKSNEDTSVYWKRAQKSTVIFLNFKIEICNINTSNSGFCLPVMHKMFSHLSPVATDQ